MSKIQHKVLFAAIAMGLSSGALAAEITKNESTPAAYVHAWELNGNTTAASNTAQNAGVIGYSIQSGDNAVLRAQDIKVVIKPTGAEFTSLNVTSQQGTAGAAMTNPDGSATFTITAPSGNLFGTGNLFTISEGDALLNSVPSAQGGTVSFTVELRDETTNALIDSASGVVMTVAQASDVKIAANTSPVLIDVGASPARTAFVGGGEVVDLGVVSVGFKDQNPATPAVDVASGLGSAVATNVDEGLFTYVPTSDRIDLTVTAENGAAFRTISPNPTAPAYNPNAGIRYMAAATGPAGTPVVQDCAANGGELFTGTANNVNEFRASFPLTEDMINHGIRICGEVNGVTEIEAQTFNATAKIDLAAAGTQDPAAVSGALATLRYNGVSIPVDHINPASNPGQQTYLRISNTSAIDGVVRISGRDDAGQAGASEVSFVLPRGESIQLTSQDLENGNADKGVSGGFGSGTGKWRATVTAELPANSVKVQNFLRNRTDAGVVNTNVNVEK